MADFTIGQGDVLPVLNDTLTYTDGTAVNLAGCTVRIIVRALTGVNPIINTTTGVTIVNAAAGQVSYTFTANDTALAGQYLAKWQVTFTGGQIQQFPTIGEIEITVEENLTTPGGARIVGLGEVKDHLRIPATDRTHDWRLLQMIDASTPVIENITGPILQHMYQDETYDGGNWFISLRHRPVIDVHTVIEYRGPIPYVLTQVPTPDLGTIYSYMWQPAGRIVRRTVGGGITTFPPGADQIFVTYTAGYVRVPFNVREATLELIRLNYQPTEQGGRPAFGSGGRDTSDDLTGTVMMGFFVPGRVRELLSTSKRHPSVA